MEPDAIMFRWGWVWITDSECLFQHSSSWVKCSRSTDRDGYNYIRMSLQLLNDFSRLKIPDINLAVFAARHNPFPTGDTETCCDAEFIILMSNVSLQAPRRLVVPKPNGIVVCCGEYEFGVWGELHLLADGIFSFGQGL